MTTSRWILFLLATGTLMMLARPAAPQEQPNLDDILEQAYQRQKVSQEQIQDYLCQATLVMRQPQKDGTAKTLVVQDKTVYFKSPDREREIFIAITKEGRALTPAEVAQAQKKADQESSQKHREQDENGSSFEFGANSPWAPEERSHYDFHLLPGDTLRGAPTYVIDFQPREKSEKFIAGRAWLHEDLFEIVRLDFRPAKNPKFVKEAHMILDFSPVAEGFWLPAELKLDAAGGFLFIKKSFQMHQTWRDYQVNVGVPDSLFDLPVLD